MTAVGGSISSYPVTYRLPSLLSVGSVGSVCVDFPVPGLDALFVQILAGGRLHQTARAAGGGAQKGIT